MTYDTEPRYFVPTIIGKLFRKLKEACRDLLPVIMVITLFQLAVLRQPFPELLEVLGGGLSSNRPYAVRPGP